MLKHRGVLIATCHDELTSPVPLPNEWIEMARNKPRDVGGRATGKHKESVNGSLSPQILLGSGVSLNGGESYDLRSKMKTDIGGSPYDGKSMEASDEDADSCTKESVWSISFTMKDFYHLSNITSDSSDQPTAWYAFYDFLGGTQHASTLYNAWPRQSPVPCSHVAHPSC